MHQGTPFQIAFVGSLFQALWESQLFSAEGLDHGTGGTRAAECVEEEPQAFPHLLVRIQDGSSLGVVYETYSQRALQFAAPRFAQDTTLQPCADHMKFSF